MPKTDAFEKTFATLRAVLEPYAKTMIVQANQAKSYQLYSAKMKDRTGKPLFVAAVQVNKNYVSFHLMPVYACPDLIREMSPTLRKRMQGKSCFNFTTVDPAHVKELAALTKRGIERFSKITLPWD